MINIRTSRRDAGYAAFSVLIFAASAGASHASDGPCASYGSAFSFTRSNNPEPVDLLLFDDRTSAKLELKIPRTFVAFRDNMVDGRKCVIKLELFWPDLTPAGPTDFDKRGVRDRWIGDWLGWRRLTISIDIAQREWTNRYIVRRYCSSRHRMKELSDRPFGLRAFDDASRWPTHLQTNGSYESLEKFAPFPLNVATDFYFVDGSARDMVRIRCSRGSMVCNMNVALGGFEAEILFNQEDLQNWRDVVHRVRQFIVRHSVQQVSSVDGPPVGVTDSRLIACEREVQMLSEKADQTSNPDTRR